MHTARRHGPRRGRQIRARVLGAPNVAAFLVIARLALVPLAVGAGLAFLLLSGHAPALAAGLMGGAVAFLLAVLALGVAYQLAPAPLRLAGAALRAVRLARRGRV